MKNKKFKFLILLLSVLLLPAMAFAANNTTVQGIVDAAVATTFYIADGVVVILWVVTGFLFLTAQGAPEKVKVAKAALFAAAVGTVVVIVANSAVYLVSDAFNLGL